MFSFLSLGAMRAVAITTRTVKIPPIIMAGFKPKALAVTPDSNAPISFDDPIKIPLTADTRPRIVLGVESCRMVCRITTLTLSNAPVRKRKKNAQKKFVERPNRIVETPNAPNDRNSTRKSATSVTCCLHWKPLQKLAVLC